MRAESTIKPSVQFEVEAFPALEGAECSIILYENIQGPFEKEVQEGASDPYYTCDRYEVKTRFHEALAANVEANIELWIEKAKAEEAAEEAPTEMEALKKEVETLRQENKDLNAAVDDLIVASLGGDANV